MKVSCFALLCLPLSLPFPFLGIICVSPVPTLISPGWHRADVPAGGSTPFFLTSSLLLVLYSDFLDLNFPVPSLQVGTSSLPLTHDISSQTV